ncbi:trypsin-like peptidase domain-containing protein [Paracoccus liaowanqingii]|uniref:Trypsin-like peptidase domain-containing protein n=1 Tax=Paracoccus liaowanqingii TaxID=2560053 RepID=A0A4P7HP28_9RHOB|nr:serine protease [Paracoccus liaowanqingii]QBX35137.1 trypsin-like peptidase domain-containing protein [Paracoccus liaowanqingii]
MLSTIRSAFLILIGGAWAIPALAQDQQAIKTAVRNSTVYLEITFRDADNLSNVCTPASQGTGFIVSRGGGVITAAHLLKSVDCPEYTIADVKGRIGYLSSPDVPLSIASIDESSDVAVLRLGAREGAYPFIEACYVDTPADEENLLAFGFPLGEDFSTLVAVYQGLSGSDGRWRLSSNFTYGMSGGPLVDGAGRVIGIVKGGVRGATAVQFVTPLNWADDALRTAGALSVEACVEIGSKGGGTELVIEDVLPDLGIESVFIVSGQEQNPVSRMFTHDFSNDASCTEGWSTQTYAACLPDNSQITNVTGPLIISAANDGRSWYDIDPNRSNCVSLTLGYSDRGLDSSGNCQGNGWIRASYKIDGIVVGGAVKREAALSMNIRTPDTAPATRVFDVPKDLVDGLLADSLSWSYRVTVRDHEGDILTQLSNTAPASGNFTSHQESNGAVVVTVEP